MKLLKKLSSKQLIAIILVIGFLVYLNALPNSFIWDDEEQIVKNALIQDVKNFPLLFSSSTFQTGGTGRLSGYYYRPLMTASFMTNFAIWRLNPLGFHLFQLFLHLANSALVFLIFFSLFQASKLKYTRLVAFFAALIFVVHPVNIEAVAYIASTQEVLYTLFSLLALFVFLIRKNFQFSLKLSLFFIFLALLSKESAIVVIPVIFLYLLIFRKREKAFYFAGASFLVVLIYSVLRILIARISLVPPHFSPIAMVAFSQRLQTIPFIIFSYFRLIFYPRNLSICHHEVVKSLNYQFWLPFLVVSGIFLAVIFWFLKTKSKLGFFFFFWFLASIGLVSNLFPLDMTFAERWLYFPLIGFLGFLSTAALQTKKRFFRSDRTPLFLIILILLLFSTRTFVRNFNWRSGLVLFSHDIAYSKNSFDLENNLGVELFRVGRVEEAKNHFEKSISLMPEWWFPYNNLGAAYEREDDLKKARELYEKSIEKGNYYLAHENLAFVVLKEEEPKKAIEVIKESSTVLPYNLKILTALAIAYYKDGQYLEAEKVARRLFSLSPSPQSLNLLEAITNRKPIEF